MSDKCFYCSKENAENEFHYVTFQSSTIEREEKLCDDCYEDWLHGIKE
ncbi:hypothetical protein GCM10008967_11240 [Bacillus carboniphilus]|uniref:Small CPxCG-related zinc finger protein n=1 Tax=Bacillus carboniphilus TaxID=86663 RepID=A0ABP3FSD7_9BACI